MTGARIDRRRLLQGAGAGFFSLLTGNRLRPESVPPASGRKPNLVFVFADQWRAQATGYSGNTQILTPYLDRLSRESVNFRNAVSGCPVCCPYRASLLTGQNPLTHRVILNDVPLSNCENSIARVFKRAGYDTGYIGKWHLDGIDRSAFIPPERRQGFDFWKAFGCTHDYHNSYYYGDGEEKRRWEGYDAEAQTKAAEAYIREHSDGRPFSLFLSWGPPHAPYHTAPEAYRKMFSPADIRLRDNVPVEFEQAARESLAGYYAHIAALDDCMGRLIRVLDETELSGDTILVFTSDHGDMLYSQGSRKKQQPWDESIRVPFLIRYPGLHGRSGRAIDTLLSTPDIMPTLLGLCGITVPATVEGRDYSGLVSGADPDSGTAALISCPSPFGQWQRSRGGREYRGLRTARYTYARDLEGPWLLFDNLDDPAQERNLCREADYRTLQNRLDEMLLERLREIGDEFLPGPVYIERMGYLVDDSGTVPYRG